MTVMRSTWDGYSVTKPIVFPLVGFTKLYPPYGYCEARRCVRKQDFAADLRQTNTTGKSLKSLSSTSRKNFPLKPSGKSTLDSCHPVPRRGALAIVTNVGTGCGGRGSVVREMCLQGGLTVSERGAQDVRR